MIVHFRCSVKHFCLSVYFKGELKSYHLHAPLKLYIVLTRLRLLAEAKGGIFKQCLGFMLFFYLAFGLAFIVASSVVL